MAFIHCTACNHRISKWATSCPKCGAVLSPRFPQIQTEQQLMPHFSQQAPHPIYTEMRHATQQQHDPIDLIDEARYISSLLFLGVIFFPFIFVWVLLHAGYTHFARVAGFLWTGCWLVALYSGLVALHSFAEPNLSKLTHATPTVTATTQTITAQPSLLSATTAQPFDLPIDQITSSALSEKTFQADAVQVESKKTLLNVTWTSMPILLQHQLRSSEKDWEDRQNQICLKISDPNGVIKCQLDALNKRIQYLNSEKLFFQATPITSAAQIDQPMSQKQT